MIKKVGRIKWQ